MAYLRIANERRPVMLLLVLVSTVLAAPGPGGCEVLYGWMDRAVEAYPNGIPARIPAADLPEGPSGFAFGLEGGAMPGGPPEAEFVVVPADPGATDGGVLRNAWLAWVEQCVESGRSDWSGSEEDLEARVQVPAMKAMGQFPLEAYIREERSYAGLRYTHAGSGALLEIITDPTEIASRSVAVGYDGPAIVLILRIVAGQ